MTLSRTIPSKKGAMPDGQHKEPQAVPTTGTMPRLDTKKIPKAERANIGQLVFDAIQRELQNPEIRPNTNAGKRIGPPRASPEPKGGYMRNAKVTAAITAAVAAVLAVLGRRSTSEWTPPPRS